MRTALKGRTHGCTGQALRREILLANPGPSTHGTKQTCERGEGYVGLLPASGPTSLAGASSRRMARSSIRCLHWTPVHRRAFRSFVPNLRHGGTRAGNAIALPTPLPLRQAFGNDFRGFG